MKVIRFLNENQGKFWYEVQIQGHTLRISSLVKLHEGKTYEIKQKSALEMQIIGELKEDHEKNPKMIQDDSSRRQMPDSIKWPFWFLQIEPDHWDQIIRIFSDENKPLMQPTEKGYYFEKGNPVKAAGFFRPYHENSYILYLYVNSDDPNKILKHIEGKILYVEKIFPVTYQHLQTLRKGLNIES